VVVERTSSTSSQLELFDRVLDRGIVIDAWMRVQLIGLDLLTIEALVVLASLPRYLESLGVAGSRWLAAATRSTQARGDEYEPYRRHIAEGAQEPAHKNRCTTPPERDADDASDSPRLRSERESINRATGTHPMWKA